MGQTLSEPVTEKHSDENGDETYIYGSSSMQGWRISMEDAHTTLLKLENSPENAFFAVYDGHGGSSTAKYAGRELHKRLARDPSYASKDYRAALKNTFLGADLDLKSDTEFKHDPSGCTAVATLITPDRIYCSNAGDSRAVMSVSGTVEALSHDHKPTNTGENQRILKAGGFVEFGRVNGNLALSRALGDFEFKKNSNLSPEEQIVTADPDILEHAITAEDEFVVIACDGIWDCMTSQEVIDFIRKEIAQRTSLAVACEKIMDNCLAQNPDVGNFGCDNMTIVVVGLLQGKSKDAWYDWMVERSSGIKANGSFTSATSTITDSNASTDDDRDGAITDPNGALDSPTTEDVPIA